jgi:hypothetical protein
MPSCKDCKFYEPINYSKGNCFGHDIPVKAHMSEEHCPSNVFHPKDVFTKMNNK